MGNTWTRYSELLKWAVMEKRRKGATLQHIENTYGIARNITHQWECVPHRIDAAWLR